MSSLQRNKAKAILTSHGYGECELYHIDHKGVESVSLQSVFNRYLLEFGKTVTARPMVYSSSLFAELEE